MCVRVFINTHSGGVRAVGAEKISSLIFHELKSANFECEITTGGPPECSDFFEIAKNAEDTTMVIVAGGDGTIAFAAKELAHTGIPVALLPGGTMNLIAHDLRIGGDIEQAIRCPKLIGDHCSCYNDGFIEFSFSKFFRGLGHCVSSMRDNDLAF